MDKKSQNLADMLKSGTAVPVTVEKSGMGESDPAKNKDIGKTKKKEGAVSCALRGSKNKYPRAAKKDKTYCLSINGEELRMYSEICAKLHLSRNDKINVMIREFIEENKHLVEKI